MKLYLGVQGKISRAKKLHLSFGWFAGNLFVLFSVRVWEITDEYGITVLDVQILKLNLNIWLELVGD